MAGGYLFNQFSAFDVSRRAREDAINRIRELDEQTVLNISTEDLIQTAEQMCVFDLPKLLVDQVYVDEREEEVVHQRRGYNIFDDTTGGRSIARMHIVEFHIPFDGDGKLFDVAPHTRSLPGPAGTIIGQELIIRLNTEGRSSGQLRAEFESGVRSINQHLETLSADLSNTRTGVSQTVRQIVEERKAKLSKSKNAVADLGFPMKRRADAPQTYKAPEVRRKISPMTPVATGALSKPEPVLGEAEYQHILAVMDNMTKVMERSPNAFRTMEEEDIRSHFLVQLNGQYEGGASGETFNYQGKTDILIHSDKRTIFIAECKIWRGEKVFAEAIDQLLKYLSWRDTKAAILVFNRNKNFSAVVLAIEHALKSYSHLRGAVTREGETRFRCVLANPDDAAREIILTVMAFDLPH